MRRPGGRRRSTVAVVGVWVLGLVLVGCGGDGEAGGQTPPVLVGPDFGVGDGEGAESVSGSGSGESASGGSLEERTLGPGQTLEDVEWTQWELERRERPVPVPPPEMAQDGEEGAVAAAEYFVEMLGYAAETGVVDHLLALSSENCDYCNEVSQRIEVASLSGFYSERNELAVSDSSVDPPNSDDPDWFVRFDGWREPRNVLDRHGALDEEVAGGNFTFYLFLEWTGEDWRLTAASYIAGGDEVPS